MVIFLFALLLAAQEIGLKEPLELKAYLDAPSPWYPNQEGKILYRISYKGKIQLTAEDLPLLEPKDFEKVGDKVIDHHDELDYSVQDISQKVKPTQGGSFTLPSSHVEGFVYELKGGKIVPLQKVESTLPPFRIEIAPFPAEGRPPSFNGSVGSFEFSLSRIGSGETQVGDWITLEIDAKGKNFSSLKFPSIACEPGIAGFFRFDDLPVQVTDSHGERKYSFRLAPLVPGITELPPISWSVFDPVAGKYTTWKSPPLSLQPRELPRAAELTYASRPLPALEIANPFYEKGEIPLSLLLLQRQWRKKPWSFAIPNSIHSIEERAGLPLSPFPAYAVSLSILKWLLLPFTLLALWRRNYLLLGIATAIALFLLSPWGKEERGVVLQSTLIKGGGALFLGGEMISIHSQTEESALVSSERQAGEIPLSTFISI